MLYLAPTLNVFFLIIQLILAFYLLLPMALLIAYGIITVFRFKTPFEKRRILTNKNFEFGIIITAHEETKFIIPLVDSILKQRYAQFDVYVIADNCNISDLVFTDARIQVFRPDKPLNAKIKSIQYAFDKMIKKPDAVIIFDADNLIHPDFLYILNEHFQKGYRVVQSNFKPKNTDSSYARMDAVGDIFNFFIEREIRMRLGLSAAIWGSGVAIDFDLYKGVEYKDNLGGFDKKLQSHLVTRVDRIAFAPDAILYDEKISSGKSLQNQRTRWISSYFKYFLQAFEVLLTGLKRLNLNLIYFGVNILRPPLFMVVGAAFAVTLLNYFVNTGHFFAWIAILIIFIVSFALIIFVKSKSLLFARAILTMPAFVFRQVLALLGLKKAKKGFMKTEHSKLIFIDDLL